MLAGTQPMHKPCPQPAEALRLIEILRLSVLCLQSTSRHSDFSAVTLLNANLRISTVVSRPSLALLLLPRLKCLYVTPLGPKNLCQLKPVLATVQTPTSSCTQTFMPG